MTETPLLIMTECLVRAMETMAFTMPGPAEPDLPAPASAVLVTMPFAGPVSGTIELVASEASGIALAANILATTPDDPAARDYARDALKELLNVTSGLLLPALFAGTPGADAFTMVLPRVEPFDAATRWQPFITSADTCVLEADGQAIALRVNYA